MQTDLPVFVFEPNGGGLLSLILTLLLPLAVAVVTTRVTSSAVKAMILLLLASVKTIVESAVAASNDSVPWAWAPVLMNVVINFGVAVAIYFGLWKPTGVATKTQENVGITS